MSIAFATSYALAKLERELEVTSVAQLGSSFLLRSSRIKLHLQQWNRMNRATRATRFLTLNLIRRLSRGVEQQ
jgi:hypothetical protein